MCYDTPLKMPKRSGISQATDLYPPGTLVWAKLRGFPWWPARVEAEDSLPSNVLSVKRLKQIPVIFFGSKDYGWIPEEHLKDFTKHKSELLKASKSARLRKAVDQAIKLEVLMQSHDGNDVFQARCLGIERSGPNREALPDIAPAANGFELSETDAIPNGKGKHKISSRGGSRVINHEKKKSSVPSVMNEYKDHRNCSTSRGVPSRSFCMGESQRKLYKIRVRIQWFMKELKNRHSRSDFPDHLYRSASRSLSSLKVFPLTSDLIKATKIDKLLRLLIRVNIEDDYENLIPQSKIILDKINHLLYSHDVHSDLVSRAPGSCGPLTDMDTSIPSNMAELETELPPAVEPLVDAMLLPKSSSSSLNIIKRYQVPSLKIG